MDKVRGEIEPYYVCGTEDKNPLRVSIRKITDNVARLGRGTAKECFNVAEYGVRYEKLVEELLSLIKKETKSLRREFGENEEMRKLWHAIK